MTRSNYADFGRTNREETRRKQLSCFPKAIQTLDFDVPESWKIYCKEKGKLKAELVKLRRMSLYGNIEDPWYLNYSSSINRRISNVEIVLKTMDPPVDFDKNRWRKYIEFRKLVKVSNPEPLEEFKPVHNVEIKHNLPF